MPSIRVTSEQITPSRSRDFSSDAPRARSCTRPLIAESGFLSSCATLELMPSRLRVRSVAAEITSSRILSSVASVRRKASPSANELVRRRKSVKSTVHVASAVWNGAAIAGPRTASGKSARTSVSAQV